MANLNKVMLIGRLTRDPEIRTFANGGKVAKFGFAVNNRRKNNQTGEWEDEPVFVDVDAFNRGEYGKLADTVEQHLRKGMQVFIEGHLRLEQWTSQDGQKRSKITVRCDNFQFLEPRAEGSNPGEGPSRSYSRPAGQRSAPPAAQPPAYEPEPDHPAGGTEDEIPF